MYLACWNSNLIHRHTTIDWKTPEVFYDFKENHVSCEMKTSPSSPIFPPPSSSCRDHQLERLFIAPLLPSASSSPLTTPISFLSCSLPLFVSRAVGQRERDVTGTEMLRGRRMREVGLECKWDEKTVVGTWRGLMCETVMHVKQESVCVWVSCVHICECVHGGVKWGKKVYVVQLQRLCNFRMPELESAENILGIDILWSKLLWVTVKQFPNPPHNNELVYESMCPCKMHCTYCFD